jgi:hypothetical protein
MLTTDWHVPDVSQHPSGQVWASQTKPVHWPEKQAAVDAHALQALPYSPHADAVVPGWHTPLVSQQPEHVYSLQVVMTHWPAWHCSDNP